MAHSDTLRPNIAEWHYTQCQCPKCANYSRILEHDVIKVTGGWSKWFKVGWVRNKKTVSFCEQQVYKNMMGKNEKLPTFWVISHWKLLEIPGEFNTPTTDWMILGMLGYHCPGFTHELQSSCRISTCPKSLLCTSAIRWLVWWEEGNYLCIPVVKRVAVAFWKQWVQLDIFFVSLSAECLHSSITTGEHHHVLVQLMEHTFQ